MSKNRLFIICSLIAVLVWRAAGAAAGVGGVIVGLTDDPMAVGGGARPLGMGRAFAAVADDVDTMFINPAGLASLRGPQGMTMYTNLINEIYYSEFCAGLPAAFGTVGLGYVITGVNQIPITVDTKTVYADYYDTMLVFSYASVLARFFDYGKDIFVGMNLKLLNRGYNGGYNQSATGVSADIGCKYVYTPYLSFAVNRQSILPPSLGGVVRWTGGGEETLAGLTKVGLAIKPRQLDGKLLVALDIDLPADSSRPLTGHLGTEWKANEYISLRGGFDQIVDAASASSTSWSPTFGISLLYARFRVDYAYHPYYNQAQLTSTYVSISFSGEPTLALKGGPQPMIEGPRRSSE